MHDSSVMYAAFFDEMRKIAEDKEAGLMDRARNAVAGLGMMGAVAGGAHAATSAAHSAPVVHAVQEAVHAAPSVGGVSRHSEMKKVLRPALHARAPGVTGTTVGVR